MINNSLNWCTVSIPAGNLPTTQQYQDFSDKHTLSQLVSGTQTNTSTYFYTTDGKNYTRLELHDQQNQLQYALDLTVMPQKNPYKQVLGFLAACSRKYSSSVTPGYAGVANSERLCNLNQGL